MKGIRKKLRGLALALSVLACLILLSPGHARAQRPREASATTQPRGSNAEPSQSREAGGEDETAEFKHSASVQLVARITGLSLENAYWLCVVLNFAVIAGLILWVSKKNLPALFRQRTESIQKAMQEAHKASEEANQRLSDIETRLSRLGSEIEKMQATAEQESVAEEARIRAAAEDDARKVVRSAEEEIAAAALAARRELKAYAADLAVSLASQQIQVDAATDKALIRNFANQLSNNGADAGKGGA
jgi:F-type H+-transporting ATPase subunit b